MTLLAQALRVRLAHAEVIRGIDLRIEPHDMVAVVGPNGSGKSTLVRTLAGLLRPSGGAVTLDGRPLARWSPQQRAARLGLLAQAAPVPELTSVREHVGLGRHARRSWLGRWTTGDEDAVRDAIDACEISHLTDRRVDALSGGERQRVRLATLLAQRPHTLLLDEPLTGLDIEHQLGLLDLLSRLNAAGRGIVCVLHDLGLALRCFPRVVVLHEGRIAADGPPTQVLCPRVFESVFRVEGRIGCELGGDPVVLCRRCTPQPINVVVRPDAARRIPPPVRRTVHT